MNYIAQARSRGTESQSPRYTRQSDADGKHDGAAGLPLPADVAVIPKGENFANMGHSETPQSNHQFARAVVQR